MKHKIQDGKTYFTLAAGSILPFGNEKITLGENTECVLAGEFSRDAVVEMIYASGNGTANVDHVKTTETRTENRNGKDVKVKYEITYGGRAQRLERELEVIEGTPDAPKIEKPKPADVPKPAERSVSAKTPKK